MIGLAAEDVLPRLLGRSTSLFDADVRAHDAELRDRIGGTRVLVIGAAGSVGAAFVRHLVGFRPDALHLVDSSENNLVELIRELRSAAFSLPGELATYSVGLGSLEFKRLLVELGRLDYVLNFAAVKHVRAERDAYSLMHMLDTNVLQVEDLLSSLEKLPPRGFFSVSSDKAVDPSSLMGASKRWMERVMASRSARLPAPSARFANVAFSDGSLPFGFLRRLEKHQPLSAPTDVRRYFITHDEAARLCLLAAFQGTGSEIFVPSVFDEDSAMSFAELAVRLLESMGLQAERYASEEEAKRSPLLSEPHPAAWPCYFGQSDTSGEKDIERFAAADETLDRSRFEAVSVVTQTAPVSAEVLRVARARLLDIRQQQEWSKADIVEAVRVAVPELQHTDRGRHLDQKM
jgi:FlaA1/EpsC-like NDP-sugar epimerase